MRRTRIGAGIAQPRGLNLTLTMPAAVRPAPAPDAPVDIPCPCGPIAAVFLRQLPFAIEGTSIVLVSGSDAAVVLFGGSFPLGTTFAVAEQVWAPTSAGTPPALSLTDEGPADGPAIPFCSVDAPFGTANGTLTFLVQATCPSDEIVSTETLTVVIFPAG